MSDDNLDAIDQALAALGIEDDRQPDPDEFTAAQLAERTAQSSQNVQKLLLAGAKSGKFTRRRICGAYWYRLAK